MVLQDFIENHAQCDIIYNNSTNQNTRKPEICKPIFVDPLFLTVQYLKYT